MTPRITMMTPGEMMYCICRRKEEDIMYEIMTQGPVQALMQIYTGTFS